MKRMIAIAVLSLSMGSALAETKIKACGLLRYGPSYEYGSHHMVFALYSSGFRFELTYLEGAELQKVQRFMSSVRRNQYPGACIEGYFGGDFSWSGFDTGGVRVSNLRAYNSERTARNSYQNLER